MNNNIDQQELAKFAKLAAHWWDTNGELKTLHQLNPIRLDYIKNKAVLAGKSVIDIGCGGGILAESMALCGANVTGIDMNPSLIEVAKLHQLESKIKINYLHTSAEAIAEQYPGQYDVVTCLELLEHVPNPASIVQACKQLLKPGGHVFFSTLNRNPKAYLFAILGAEYLFRLLPKNTHDYAKFIRPSELNHWARNADLTPQDITGISYNPWSQQVKLTADVSINYLLHATRNDS